MRYKQRVISSKFLRDQVRAANFCPSPSYLRRLIRRTGTRPRLPRDSHASIRVERYRARGMTCRFGNHIKRVMQQWSNGERKDRKARKRGGGGVGPPARGYAIRYAVIISRYKFLARSTWAVAFLLLSAADPFYWSAFRSSIMHLMQLGTYPRLNARALSLSLSLALSPSHPRPPAPRNRSFSISISSYTAHPPRTRQ